MSPRTSKQFEQLRNQKIELIEKAALKCFASQGFHNTSISTIAKEAGISTGLMYNYFKSKEELFKSIYVQGMQIAFQPIVNRDTPLSKEDFIGFITHTFKELKANSDYWKTFMMVMVQPDIMNDYQEYIMKSVMPIMSTFTQYFEAQGYENPMVECRMFLSMMDGVGLHYIVDTKNYPLEAIKQKIIGQYEKQ